MIEVPRREDNSKTGKQLESGGKHLIFGRKTFRIRRKTFDFWEENIWFLGGKHLKTSEKHLNRVWKQLESGGKHFNRVYFTRKTIFNAVKLLDLVEISLVEEQDMNSEIFNKVSSW